MAQNLQYTNTCYQKKIGQSQTASVDEAVCQSSKGNIKVLTARSQKITPDPPKAPFGRAPARIGGGAELEKLSFLAPSAPSVY
jgi:hypothetical protein